jgi:aspartyl-tRNA(Asn)/glutamyl-tRNA(Gln) amidotransferase subunit B
MPLLEIVTEPEIDHPEDGKLAVKELQDLLKYAIFHNWKFSYRALNISEANMEEGQMRCDINISVNTEERKGNRVEIKNVLGIKFVEKAIEHEI